MRTLGAILVTSILAGLPPLGDALLIWDDIVSDKEAAVLRLYNVEEVIVVDALKS